ncbi:hypothetical protein ABE10_12245, partial [Bacillus toyonensis]|nr:hypothetical protein [Bacillus toyonensis]
MLGDVELRLVAGAEQVVGLLLVQGDGAADVGADLRVGDDAVVGPVLAVVSFDQLLGEQAHEQDDGLGLLLEVAFLVPEGGERLGDDVHSRAEGDVRGTDGGAVGIACQARPLVPHGVLKQLHRVARDRVLLGAVRGETSEQRDAGDDRGGDGGDQG